MEHPENSGEYKGLAVNKGIEQPSSVNPYLKRKPKKRQLSVAEFVEGIVKGDITILSQAVTLVESVKPEHQVVAQEVIEKCLPHSGNSVRIGISGVPGAGKSTSIDVFGLHVLEKGGKLAVLAIDPSSERSKGSILGDKTRMEQLSVHPKSFIRPSPSAGSLGGVARKTRETIVLCEAAGFDKIFVETVGVGQSETAVHSMVDFFLLIQLAGTGDELQGIKRGIMEMADGIVINKADGDNLERAKLAATQFRNALHLFPAPESGWTPQVLTYSGFYNIGVKEIWDMIYEYIRRDEERKVESIQTALDHVDLDVKQGDFIAILGHNGSGKSTLAKHINALLAPSEGSLFVDGMDVSKEENVIPVRKTAGMVFQNPDNQIIASVVEEDVGFGPENIGVPTDEIWQRVEESLKAVGMLKYRHHSPNKLSGGQKQRVAIAGVVAMEPKCIVLDEPTAMLDPNGRADVIRTAHELNQKKGVTIILITHYMEEVVGADKVIVMDKGKVVMQGTPREIFSQVGKLKEYRLDVPQVTILADLLRQSGLDIPLGVLTREELVGHILRIAQIDS